MSKKNKSENKGKSKAATGKATGGKRFSKTGIALVGCMLVCLIVCLAVGLPNGFGGLGGNDKNLDDENTPGIKEVMNEGSPIFIFDKREETKALMTAFDEDQVEQVKLIYDYGKGETVETSCDTEADITEVYKALKNIIVIEETDQTVSDANHSVTFTMEDGTSCCFQFQGDTILTIDDQNYEISGAGDLMKLMQKKCKL